MSLLFLKAYKEKEDFIIFYRKKLDFYHNSLNKFKITKKLLFYRKPFLFYRKAVAQ